MQCTYVHIHVCTFFFPVCDWIPAFGLLSRQLSCKTRTALINPNVTFRLFPSLYRFLDSAHTYRDPPQRKNRDFTCPFLHKKIIIIIITLQDRSKFYITFSPKFLALSSFSFNVHSTFFSRPRLIYISLVEWNSDPNFFLRNSFSFFFFLFLLVKFIVSKRHL